MSVEQHILGWLSAGSYDLAFYYFGVNMAPKMDAWMRLLIRETFSAAKFHTGHYVAALSDQIIIISRWVRTISHIS